MSPRVADVTVRTALLDAAAQVLAEEGSTSLTTRRLADMVGTSTTSVYTHFRGMPELLRALRVEGFARFAAHLEVVGKQADPVAELFELGAAYLSNAVENPHLYRFMFMEKPADQDVTVGLETFNRLVDPVARAIAAGRFNENRPRKLATQLWVGAHGIVSLVLAGLVPHDEGVQLFNATALSLFIGFGDDEQAARASLRKALRRIRSTAPVAG